jgi:hypothetical protein
MIFTDNQFDCELFLLTINLIVSFFTYEIIYFKVRLFDSELIYLYLHDDRYGPEAVVLIMELWFFFSCNRYVAAV